MIMNVNYFAKNEQINKGVRAMIIMDIKIDNLYCFKNFHMNMSYPKKVVDSTIDCEYLEDRPNFRYKKVNIIMGNNATGKTTLGKILNCFVDYFDNKNYKYFTNVICDNSVQASLKIDFVSKQNILYRFEMIIPPMFNKNRDSDNIKTGILGVEIGKRDNYEICAKKLDESQGFEIDIEEIDTSGWHFIYSDDAWSRKFYYSIEEDSRYLLILEKILQTLDPSIHKVIKVDEVQNTYAIQLSGHSVIIKEGKILDAEMLSSGTKAGLEISYIIASLLCDIHHLYYCDECFSYVHSEIEKACLSIIIEKLKGRKQLFFTTHNTNILDMQLPKHSFTFLKKDVNNPETSIVCVNAADYLKRNTDSLKHAVENDLFSTAPELDKIFSILDL